MHGYDRVRNTQIGKTDVPLKYFEEVFTSEHWMMRIYRCGQRYAFRYLLQKKLNQRALGDVRSTGAHSRLPYVIWWFSKCRTSEHWVVRISKCDACFGCASEASRWFGGQLSLGAS
jgi:hypothetical protein